MLLANRRFTLIVLFLAFTLTASSLSLLVENAGSQSAKKGNFDVIRKRGDSFRNYDFRSEQVSRKNVDWAVTLLFFNDAEIGKVKDALFDPYDQTGGAMYGRLKNNGGASRWDSDAGKKTTLCPGAFRQPDSAFHYRIYATPVNDRMYNRVWGYYVFGSTHVDYNECGQDDTTYFGRTELAENYLSDTAAAEFGTNNVLDDHRSFGNEEPFRRQGNHIWFNNKLATYVRVP